MSRAEERQDKYVKEVTLHLNPTAGTSVPAVLDTTWIMIITININ